jgi:hypothetical protein
VRIAEQARRCHAPLGGKAQIGLVIGNMINGHKVAWHLVLTSTDAQSVCQTHTRTHTAPN